MALKPRKQAKIIKTTDRDGSDLVLRLFAKNRKLGLRMRFVGWMDNINALLVDNDIPVKDVINTIALKRAARNRKPYITASIVNMFNKKQVKRAELRDLDLFYQLSVSADGLRLHEFVKSDSNGFGDLPSSLIQALQEAIDNRQQRNGGMVSVSPYFRPSLIQMAEAAAGVKLNPEEWEMMDDDPEEIARRIEEAQKNDPKLGDLILVATKTGPLEIRPLTEEEIKLVQDRRDDPRRIPELNPFVPGKVLNEGIFDDSETPPWNEEETEFNQIIEQAKQDASPEGVLKVGLTGTNIEPQGGLRRGEMYMVSAGRGEAPKVTPRGELGPDVEFNENGDMKHVD